jgi:galactokinase
MLPLIPLADMVDQAKQSYAKTYGSDPQWVVMAPGRVNLIGEHTDYNDGFVMPMAIERFVVIAAGRPASASESEDRLTVYSDAIGEKCTVEPAQAVADDLPLWGVYIRGVLVECRKLGYQLGDVQAVIHANVPLGGGLSSSAALEVATATLCEAVSGKTMDGREKAKLCQRAENEHVGMPCGIMDQFSSALCQADELMLLDCRSLATTPVPLADPQVTVLITNSNVKRQLASSEYPIRRGQCETAATQLKVAALRDADLFALEKMQSQMEDVVFRRARHVIGENQRVLDMQVALANNDWQTAGELMYASHESLRRDYEVSCDELNVLVDSAKAIGTAGGVIGSRLTGAGFGGCTVTLVRTGAVNQVAEKIASEYLAKFKIEPTMFTSRPGPGAHIVSAAT